ncbi:MULTISPECIES: hypothetical protein [unclassified Microcoleus]|uniref:hypothetical protein n=1 Tax=unclassified Microcoleus TaxID=2642155 RepID=UPI002FCEABB0
MQSAIRITTKVLAGDKLEIQVPPGSVGEEVEVFVIIPEKPCKTFLDSWNMFSDDFMLVRDQLSLEMREAFE